MAAPDFKDLIGLELTIARLAASMRIFGFGPVIQSSERVGTVATLALHLQCPWRLANKSEILTGSEDLWEFVGSGDEPDGWEPVHGSSLQTLRLESLLGARLGGEKSSYYASGILVTGASSDAITGDLAIDLSSGHRLAAFPCGSRGEQWRLFSPWTDAPHLVFEFSMETQEST